jgi:hypothetical protein
MRVVLLFIFKAILLTERTAAFIEISRVVLRMLIVILA